MTTQELIEWYSQLRQKTWLEIVGTPVAETWAKGDRIEGITKELGLLYAQKRRERAQS